MRYTTMHNFGVTTRSEDTGHVCCPLKPPEAAALGIGIVKYRHTPRKSSLLIFVFVIIGAILLRPFAFPLNRSIRKNIGTREEFRGGIVTGPFELKAFWNHPLVSEGQMDAALVTELALVFGQQPKSSGKKTRRSP